MNISYILKLKEIVAENYVRKFLERTEKHNTNLEEESNTLHL